MPKFLKSIVPEKPAYRAVSLAALAAAGCGGLYFASRSGVLAGRESFVVKPWQVVTFVSFIGNSVAIFSGGRLDSASQKQEGTEAKTELPPDRFFSPAGWAFAIWGPILYGEKALVWHQVLPLESVRASSGWLSQLTPWLGSAFLLQTCWCLSFRRWARDSGLLWFPAALLGGTATCLGGAHGVLRTAVASGSMPFHQYSMVHVPISLHYAWVSCATLVNANAYVALLPKLSEKTRLRISLGSITAAAFLAANVTLGTGDPIYAAVVAWALAAIANEKGWESMKGLVEASSLKSQRGAACVGSVACAVAALVAPLTKRLL